MAQYNIESYGVDSQGSWAKTLLTWAGLTPSHFQLMQPGLVSIFGGPGSGKSYAATKLEKSFKEAGQNVTFIGTESEYGPDGYMEFHKFLKLKPEKGCVYIVDSLVLLTLLDCVDAIQRLAVQAEVLPKQGSTNDAFMPYEVLKASRAAGLEPKYIWQLFLLDRIYAKCGALLIVVDNPLAPEETNQSKVWMVAEEGIVAGVICLANRQAISVNLRTWAVSVDTQEDGSALKTLVPDRTVWRLGGNPGQLGETEALVNILSHV